ncbi:hypothetical protein AB0C52_30690 [Streptomyces sp. NPDC048717]|uniref:hypothetical protein n=1 Tax=Streptomyces sp. NPDC048717 TaxID=3154928 RepID=UPI0034120BA7
MSVRHAKQIGRGIATAALATGLILGLSGCGGDEKPAQDDKPGKSSSPAKAEGGSDGQQSSRAQEPAEVLGTLTGQDGFELTVNSAERDAGGFLTLKGSLKNTSSSAHAFPALARGDETEIAKHSNSLGGATLLDAVGKKRYYVLRDTDGRPLTTTGLDIMKAGASVPVFMQFPAPPATTTEVSLQLPTFTPATIKLS